MRYLHRIALLGIGPSESPGINQPSVLDNGYRSALYLPLAQEIPDELFHLPGSRKIGIGIRYFLIDGAKVGRLLHILGDVLGRGCGGPRENQNEKKQRKRHPKGFFITQSPVTVPYKIPYVSCCYHVVDIVLLVRPKPARLPRAPFWPPSRLPRAPFSPPARLRTPYSFPSLRLSARSGNRSPKAPSAAPLPERECYLSEWEAYIFMAVSVFFISIAMVIGPTPPGTGVM